MKYGICRARLGTLGVLGMLGFATGCGGGGSDGQDDSGGPDGLSTTVEASVGAPVPSEYAFLRSGSIAYEDMPATWAALPYTRISIERQGCFGSCPDYTVEIQRGSGEGAGLATYAGRLYTPRQGSFSGEIDIWDYGHLCELLARFDFYALEENYSAQWTDDATVIVEASRGTTTHRVLDYGRQGPPELVALQLSIDAVADRIEWRGADDPTVPPAGD